MTHRLTTDYAKNYCNRTLIVKVIVETVYHVFFGKSGRQRVNSAGVLLSDIDRGYSTAMVHVDLAAALL